MQRLIDFHSNPYYISTTVLNDKRKKIFNFSMRMAMYVCMDITTELLDAM